LGDQAQGFARLQALRRVYFEWLCDCIGGVTMTYGYKQTEPGLYTVGFYSPGGEWHPDSDHGSKQAAADRVAFLNGGGCSPAASADLWKSKYNVSEAKVNQLHEALAIATEIAQRGNKAWDTTTQNIIKAALNHCKPDPVV